MAPAAKDDPVAAAQSLSSPAAQQAFKDALTRIQDSMKAVQLGFDDGKGGLATIPTAGTLQTQWEKLGKQYQDIRWNTKDTSTEVSTYIEQLGTVQLPIASGEMGAPDDEILATLKDFRDGSKDVGTRAGAQVSSFTNLKKSLLDFKQQYQAFYAKQGGQQSSEITQLTNEISQITNRIEEINEEIKKLALEQQETFLKRNKWVLALPIVNLIAVIVDMIKDAEVKKQIDQLKAEYEASWSKLTEKKVALNKAQSTSQALSKTKVTIDTLTDSRFTDVLGGLQIFADVFQAADNDVEDLIEYKTDNTKPVPLCLVIYQKTGGSAYTGVQGALQAFAIGSSR